MTATVNETIVVHKTPRAKKLIQRLVLGVEKDAACVGIVPAATVGDRVSHFQIQESKARTKPPRPLEEELLVGDEEPDPNEA
mmetsp:Transcript_36254/g.75407  ORF Transcript_36254/g.75407 Transcript_36254/m.75407 type:complete len:82 (+) Transcript_36254:511-756(+)